MEGFGVLCTDHSSGLVHLRLGRAGRSSKTLLLFSESGRPQPLAWASWAASVEGAGREGHRRGQRGTEEGGAQR